MIAFARARAAGRRREGGLLAVAPVPVGVHDQDVHDSVPRLELGDRGVQLKRVAHIAPYVVQLVGRRPPLVEEPDPVVLAGVRRGHALRASARTADDQHRTAHVCHSPTVRDLVVAQRSLCFGARRPVPGGPSAGARSSRQAVTGADRRVGAAVARTGVRRGGVVHGLIGCGTPQCVHTSLSKTSRTCWSKQYVGRRTLTAAR